MSNLTELWDRVSHTDPAHTRPVADGKGLTSIAATSQHRKATEIWGRYGEGWGLEYEPEDMKIFEFGEKKVVLLHARFWYKDQKGKFVFPISADVPWNPRCDDIKKVPNPVHFQGAQPPRVQC